MKLNFNQVLQENCLEVLREYPNNIFDSIITDPPYELNFMGKSWDNTGIAYSVDMWREVLRVLKPGGHLLAFGGTRTYHRMACAIEDAGFEIRDCIQWLYGSGFPKSHNISKAIDKAAGAEREVIGEKAVTKDLNRNGRKGDMHVLGEASPTKVDITAPATEEAKQWDGWGTALKPANEPIVVARKPLSEKTVAANVLKWGTGGLNIDGCRIETDEVITNHSRGAESAKSKGKYGDSSAQETHQTQGQKLGRFPANIILDEEAAEVLDEQQEGASRFFYVAKASKKERTHGGKVENKHPTVKPIKLMSYLITLVTPPGGVVLDPFCGSGTTLVAAQNLGFNFVGIDIEEESVETSKARLLHSTPSKN